MIPSLEEAFIQFFESRAKAHVIVLNAKAQLEEGPNKWLDVILADAEALFKKPGSENQTKNSEDHSGYGKVNGDLLPTAAHPAAKSAKIRGKQR